MTQYIIFLKYHEDASVKASQKLLLRWNDLANLIRTLKIFFIFQYQGACLIKNIKLKDFKTEEKRLLVMSSVAENNRIIPAINKLNN